MIVIILAGLLLLLEPPSMAQDNRFFKLFYIGYECDDSLMEEVEKEETDTEVGFSKETGSNENVSPDELARIIKNSLEK